MNVKIDIPALDRLVDFFEKVTAEKLQAVVRPDAPPAEASAPAKDKKEKKEKPAPEPEAPAAEEKAKAKHTAKEVEDLARAFIAKTSPGHSRKLLDENGFKGRKLGEAKDEELDALFDLFEKANKEHEDSGL